MPSNDLPRVAASIVNGRVQNIAWPSQWTYARHSGWHEVTSM